MQNRSSTKHGDEDHLSRKRTHALRFTVVTIFPEFFSSFCKTSLIAKSIERGGLIIDFIDPRDFSGNRHRRIDDTPYGGGPGMLLAAPPLIDAMNHVDRDREAIRILLSPQGKPFRQTDAHALTFLPESQDARVGDHASDRKHIVLICGRYEGFDDRIRDHVDREYSIGDVILNGGETAALAVVEATSRLLPGFLGDPHSIDNESFTDATRLTHPQYTRPPKLQDCHPIPDVLLSGDHQRIATWREDQKVLRTQARRPDLFREYVRTLWQTRRDTQQPIEAETYICLLHHPIIDKAGETITTSVTNLDIHDFARLARTYGLAGVFVVTPNQREHDLIGKMMSHWKDGRHGQEYNPHRSAALNLVRLVNTYEDAICSIGKKNVISIGTSAQTHPQITSFVDVRAKMATKKSMVCFGTGWGMAPEICEKMDLFLPPIGSPSGYNHLSVRSAASIIIDRLISQSPGS